MNNITPGSLFLTCPVAIAYDNAETGLEKRVKSIQLNESRNIIPDNSGDILVINFILFGRNDNLLFNKEE